MKTQKSVFLVGIEITLWAVTLWWLLGQLLKGGLRDPDLWWHLTAGRTMMETRTFLRSDIFSFTKVGERWINFEWLSQILLYQIQTRWGNLGLYVLRILMSAVSLIFLFLSIRKSGAKKGLALFLLLIGFLMVDARFQCRPELFTLVLLPLFIWLALVTVRTTSPQLRSMPFIFAGLMILWVNLHAGFIYGIAVLSLMSLGLRWGRTSADIIRTFDRSTLLCLLAVFVNPYGLHLIQIFWAHLVQLIQGPKNVIAEWGVTDMSSHGTFWMVYVGAALSAVMTVVQRNRKIIYWVPIVFIFALWGALFVRNIALFAFIAVPFLAEVISQRIAAMPARRAHKFSFLFWVFVLIPFVTNLQAFSVKPARPLVDERWNPARACDFLKEHKITENIFNTYHYGGYLSWVLGPQVKVFWDGRYIFHPMMVDFLKTMDQYLSNPADSPWPAYLDRYKITAAVVEPPRLKIPLPDNEAGVTDAEALFPRSQWALVFWDDAALVYLRRTPYYEAIIENEEFRAAYPENVERLRMKIAAHEISTTTLNVELNREKRNVGFTYLGYLQEQQIQ